MDFLDSLDLDVSKYKKSRRVRSWYLYEQFKSLERNQLDAARQLKNRSYQDKILQRELSERRARRNLYDQFELSQSESGIDHSDSTKTPLNISNDDFFESFHDLQEDGLAKIVVQDLLDTCSQEDQQTDELYENIGESNNERNDHSGPESADSVININFIVKSSDNVNTKLEMEQKTKFEDNVFAFDDVTDKLQYLERLTQLKDYDKLSDTDNSQYSLDIKEMEIKQTVMKDKNVNASDKNIYFMWSKLVSFASQVMQLNHGNCYHDYGSQFLTAVLACDVLRRGINRMCHILQLYVSPIKYATDSKPASECCNNYKRRKPVKSKRYRRINKLTRNYPHHSISKSRTSERSSSRKWRFQNVWEEQYVPFDILEYNSYSAKDRRIRQPWRSITKRTLNRRNTTSKSSYHSIWPITSEDSRKKSDISLCTCRCHRVENPMLRLSSYLDRLMRDINDPMFI